MTRVGQPVRLQLAKAKVEKRPHRFSRIALPAIAAVQQISEIGIASFAGIQLQGSIANHPLLGAQHHRQLAYAARLFLRASAAPLNVFLRLGGRGGAKGHILHHQRVGGVGIQVRPIVGRKLAQDQAFGFELDGGPVRVTIDSIGGESLTRARGRIFHWESIT